MKHYTSFIETYRPKTYKKGEIILSQEEVPEGVYVIKSGVIKTYNITSNGEEKPIAYDVPLSLFPIGWLFHKINSSQYLYEAFTDCELYCIPRDELSDFLRKNNQALYEIMDKFVAFHVGDQMRLNALEQAKSLAKVTHTLHYLCMFYGKKVGRNDIRIKLPLTQQEMANFMGLTRETTGLVLKNLQRSGILTYTRKNYSLKIDKFENLLQEKYGFGLEDSPKPYFVR